jgi:hypothetical protein
MTIKENHIEEVWTLFTLANSMERDCHRSGFFDSAKTWSHTADMLYDLYCLIAPMPTYSDQHYSDYVILC